MNIHVDIAKEVAKEINEQAAEKLNKLEVWWKEFYPDLLTFGAKLLFSIIIYFIAKKLINLVLKITRHAFDKSKIEVSATNFICSLIKALLYGCLFIGLFMWFGVPQASFVALIGSVGLTIGLALQGSLSNFAGGVLILVLKPFRIGDYIIANGKEGTVTSIDIIYTRIVTFDNKTIIFPNGTLANTDIINVTDEPTRRLDLIIPIGYNDDIKTVKEELLNIGQNNAKVLQDQPIDLFVSNYGNDAIEIALRVWTKKDDYMVVKGDLLEAIKYMFDEKGFTIPFHQLEVNIINPQA
jgi:small conductance mechanosensitive channel